MAPMCLQYLPRNDDVAFDLAVLNKVDLFHRDAGLDRIIFAGPPPDEEAKNLIHRRIARYVSRLYASPDYLHGNGTPMTVDELRRHPLLRTVPLAEPRSGRSPMSKSASSFIQTEGHRQKTIGWRSCQRFRAWASGSSLNSSPLRRFGPGFWPCPAGMEFGRRIGRYLYHAHWFSNPQIKALVTFLATQFHGFYRFPTARTISMWVVSSCPDR